MSRCALGGPIPGTFSEAVSLGTIVLALPELPLQIRPRAHEFNVLVSSEELWLSENGHTGPIPPTFGDPLAVGLLFLSKFLRISQVMAVYIMGSFSS